MRWSRVLTLLLTALLLACKVQADDANFYHFIHPEEEIPRHHWEYLFRTHYTDLRRHHNVSMGTMSRLKSDLTAWSIFSGPKRDQVLSALIDMRLPRVQNWQTLAADLQWTFQDFWRGNLYRKMLPWNGVSSPMDNSTFMQFQDDRMSLQSWSEVHQESLEEVRTVQNQYWTVIDALLDIGIDLQGDIHILESNPILWKSSWIWQLFYRDAREVHGKLNAQQAKLQALIYKLRSEHKLIKTFADQAERRLFELGKAVGWMEWNLQIHAPPPLPAERDQCTDLLAYGLLFMAFACILLLLLLLRSYRLTKRQREFITVTQHDRNLRGRHSRSLATAFATAMADNARLSRSFHHQWSTRDSHSRSLITAFATAMVDKARLSRSFHHQWSTREQQWRTEKIQWADEKTKWKAERFRWWQLVVYLVTSILCHQRRLSIKERREIECARLLNTMAAKIDALQHAYRFLDCAQSYCHRALLKTMAATMVLRHRWRKAYNDITKSSIGLAKATEKNLRKEFEVKTRQHESEKRSFQEISDNWQRKAERAEAREARLEEKFLKYDETWSSEYAASIKRWHAKERQWMSDKKDLEDQIRWHQNHPRIIRQPIPKDPFRFYEVLGIKPSATDREVMRAYKTAVLRHHPDKHGHDEKDSANTRIHLINEAKDRLNDPTSRARYNEEYGYNQASNDPGVHFQFYNILNLPTSATVDEVKKASEALTKIHVRDGVFDGSIRGIEVATAGLVLGDEVTRARYDRFFRT